jgi:alpha-amylase
MSWKALQEGIGENSTESDRSTGASVDPTDDTGFSSAESTGLGRRAFLGATTAALLGTSAVRDAAALPDNGDPTPPSSDADGEPVIYQYFHTPWSEIEADLDRLAEAGIDAIWVPQPAKPKLSWQHQATADQVGYYGDKHPVYGTLEPHPPIGYQPVDLLDFQSPHGTEAELRSMIEAAHDKGIEVIVDAVLNHVATRDAPADRWGNSDDPTARVTLSWDQYNFGPGDIHDKGQLNEGCGDIFECSLLGLPDLDPDSRRVQRVHEQYLRKIADLGADGVRFDAAQHVHKWYWTDVINPLCDQLGLWRVGEVWSNDVTWVEEFVDTGMAAFDFPLQGTIVEAFGAGDLLQLTKDFNNGYIHHGDPVDAVTFAQNHDTPGPWFKAQGFEESRDPRPRESDLDHWSMELAAAYLLTAPGIPHLFKQDIEDPAIQRLIDVKRTLASGTLIDRHAGHDAYVYERAGNLLVGLGVVDREQTLTVDTSWQDAALVEQTGNGEDLDVDENGEVQITIPPRGYVVYAPDGEGPSARTIVYFTSGRITVEEDAPATVEAGISAGEEALPGTAELRVDGSVVDTVSVDLDAGETTSVSFRFDTTPFDAGEHELDLAFADRSDTATLVVRGQRPYEGTPHTLPGRIQAEEFDEGGEGVAYHDTTATDEGGVFRTDEGADVDTTTDEIGEYTLGWIRAEEWVEYTVDVETAGVYEMTARVASAMGGGAFHLEVEGGDGTETLAFDDTGGWHDYTTVTASGVSLPAGETTIRVVMEERDWNLNWLSFALERPSVTGRKPASDPDGDGRYEDVDGDGDASVEDVMTYYRNRHGDAIRKNPERFDFDGDGEAGTVFDVVRLFDLIE